MYRIAIGLQKGGVGKTISTVCLGGALAAAGRKVLLIDLDPQANTTTCMGVDETTLTTPTSGDLLTNPSFQIARSIIVTDFGIDLIPAAISMAVQEKQLQAATSHKKLSIKLEDLEKMGKTNPRLAYDYVIMDCPPSLGALTLNALAAANGVIAPVNGEHLAEKGLRDFLETLTEVQQELNHKMEFMGVLLTQMSNIKTHRDVAALIREGMGSQVFKTVISRRAVLTEVPLRGPVQSYAPTSESAQEYNALGEEVDSYVRSR